MLTACSPQFVWVKEGATEAGFERDKAQCQYEAAAATANYNTGPTARGYSGAVAQGIGEGIAIGMRQAELIQLCLQAKGYSKQSIQYSGQGSSYGSGAVSEHEGTQTAGRLNDEKGNDKSSASSNGERAFSIGTTVRPFAEPLGLYRAATQSSERIRKLTKEDRLRVMGSIDEWLEVSTEEGTTGWVKRIWVR